MRGLQSIASSDAFRVRRWDVLMLGSALPGLVAAARLGQRGLRVLVLEEHAPSDLLDAAREPFLLVDAESQGVLAECLRAIGVPLIDQRRFVSEEVALQVCDAKRRVDFGRGTRTAEEWQSWGLAERDDARRWVSALDEAAEREREALIETPLALGATRRARGALAAPRRNQGGRGWPDALRDLPPDLAEILQSSLRALSNLGATPPSPEARSRLLGGLMRGGVGTSGGDGQLRALLRRRVASLYGEFRVVDKPFQLVSVAGQAGVAVEGSKEIWTSRALVLNAPARAIAEASEASPDLFRGEKIAWRRHALHYRGPREQLPSCMAERVIWRDLDDGESVALRSFPGRRQHEPFDLFASVVVPEGDDAAVARGEARIERALRDLLPFSEGALERHPLPVARWDSDALLAEPSRQAWPEEPELRLSNKPPVYALERAAVGGLGADGELWLGWRAGDAIGEALA